MSIEPARSHHPAPRLIEDAMELATDQTQAARYMEAFAKHAASALITNASSKAMLLSIGDFRLPVMIEDGSYGDTYVAHPHSAYVLYARDEIDIIGLKAGRTLAKGVLYMLDRMLRSVRINQAVQLDNWLLSTNLHGDWSGAGLTAIRETLCDRFPDHFIMMRSLDPWSCPELMNCARNDGWTLLPSRQIWITDDLEANWKKRNNTKNDRRLVRKSGLAIEELGHITRADADRIVDLYRQLYIGRYSAINPVFTSLFVQTASRIGLLAFVVARAPDGRIMAFSGIRSAGGIATIPLMGYDFDRPQSEGLYRIASYIASDWAMQRGLRFHGSAGAGTFKQNRGARSEIEYMAVYDRHLSATRRAGLGFLARSLNALMVPLLKKQGW